jgi:hypothetical protein
VIGAASCVGWRFSGAKSNLIEIKPSGFAEADNLSTLRQLGAPPVANSCNTNRTERWERGFAALSRFRERERHCCPSREHIEGNVKLGQWVSDQRYRKDQIPVERKSRLDAIGFVWDWRDYLWDEHFAVLLKFKQRSGHCLVPSLYNDGVFKLGYWVSVQRRHRNEMSGERRARLNEIGFVWTAAMGRPRKFSGQNPPPPPASPPALSDF